MAYTEYPPSRFFLSHVGESLMDLSAANEEEKLPGDWDVVNV